ncbi:PulJ/GspJ family protein [Timonella sp. A28]|uniref:PulJ/GspJ family protein n=1 Tax=Timonella sp. A28 TaxID=3442640 RepID=UPI003EBA594A
MFQHITSQYRDFRSHHKSSEAGMSLVELIVYIVLVAIVGTLVTGLIINVFRVNTDVQLTSESSNNAQNLMDRVELTIRNATAYTVVPGTNSELLVAEVRSTEQGLAQAEVTRCVGIYFDYTTQNVHYVSDAANGGARSKTAAANPAVATNWPIFLADVKKTSGTPIFTPIAGGTRVNFQVQPAALDRAIQLTSAIDARALGSSTGACL